MKTELITIGLILSVMLLTGCAQQPSEPISKECLNNGHYENNYCVYNVSSSLAEYISPGVRVPKEYKIGFENTSAVMTRNPNSNVSEYFDTHTCVETGNIPQVVQFWYYAACKPGIDGCGWQRSAVICGNKYFIYEMSSSEGPVLYGPFSLKQ